MGQAFHDIDSIKASSENEFDIALRQHSPFVLETLDLPFRSPSKAGTGPFAPVGPNSPTELQANDRYYLGRSIIDRIVVSTYPTVRAAWAEMLRDHLDVLYDVGTDALDSLEGSNKISVFTYVRPYQYALIFNTRAGVFRPPQVRRALSQAVDREALVREALNGHGVPSSGSVWPRHWAIEGTQRSPNFDVAAAAAILAQRGLRFTCLVPPDYERLALALKRQLQAVNVSMDVSEVPPDEIDRAMARGEFDAVLLDVLSGPSVFRLFRIWHSGEATNPSGFSSPRVDAGLDEIRRAATDNAYRSGVAAFRAAMDEDPPAIFLAWSVRARAVSNRFVVPPAESGRDIMSTLRLWKPTNDARSQTSRN